MTDRCPEPCGKQRHSEEYLAQLVCMQAAMRGRHRRWYWSRPCHSWHLTSSRGGGVGGRRGRWAKSFAADPPAA